MDMTLDHTPLFIPGPSEVRAEIRNAQARSMIGHNSDESISKSRGMQVSNSCGRLETESYRIAHMGDAATACIRLVHLPCHQLRDR